MPECRVPSAKQIDGCAVPTHELAAEVNIWIARWERDHPDLATSRNGRQSSGAGSRRNDLGQLAGNEAVGAVAILHERTCLVDPGGEGVPKTTIVSVVKSRWQTTELRTADLLVAAIERPEAFYDGALSVIPNPRASLEAQASCCGGSMNGSLT